MQVYENGMSKVTDMHLSIKSVHDSGVSLLAELTNMYYYGNNTSE